MFCLALLPLFALTVSQAAGPDPSNGYEDYLRAAHVLDDNCADLFYRWDPKNPVKAGGTDNRQAVSAQLKELDYLGVQAAMAKRYGKALDFLRLGNTKRVWTPWRGDENRPHLVSPFFALAHLCCAQAYVNFSAGDSKGGTQNLLDGLTFARNISEDRVIDLLVGYASDQDIFNCYGRSLGSIGQADAQRTLAFVEGLLSKPSVYPAVLRRARDARLKDLQSVFAKPTEANSSYQRFIAQMSEREKKEALNQVADEIDRSYQELLQRLNGPESQWYMPVQRESMPEDPRIDTSADLVRFLAFAFRPTDITRFVIVDRIQLRLLDLHMRIIDYRWRNGKFPEKLSDAAPANLAIDPATNSEFIYSLNQTRKYRLYSKGLPETGQIDLAYHDQGGLSPGTVPPPFEGGTR